VDYSDVAEVYKTEERRLDSRLNQVIFLFFEASSSLPEATQMTFKFLPAVIFLKFK